MNTHYELYEAMSIVCKKVSDDLILSEDMRNLVHDLRAGHRGYIQGRCKATPDAWTMFATQLKAGPQHCQQGLRKCQARAAKIRARTDYAERLRRLSDDGDDCEDIIAMPSDVAGMYSAAELSSHVMQERAKHKSFSCHWKSISPMVMDFSPGDVLVIAGYSGSGKTNFAMQLSYFAGKNTLYFGVDMSPRSFGERLWRTAWYRDNMRYSHECERSACEAALFNALQHGTFAIQEGIEVYKGSSMSLGQIETISRGRMEHKQFDVLVIDYAGRVENDKHNREQWRADAEIARSIKGMAMRLGIRVIALAQLNSNNEQGKKPEASWLSGSKELIAASDGVVVLWHDWGVDHTGSKTKITTHVNISDDIKARNTGSNGNARLECFGLWLHEEII